MKLLKTKVLTVAPKDIKVGNEIYLTSRHKINRITKLRNNKDGFNWRFHIGGEPDFQFFHHDAVLIACGPTEVEIINE